MKLLFLGCSWTYGDELASGHRAQERIIEKRFSTIIGKRLNAEVVNLSSSGLSNHAIARKFLNQDLKQYDHVFVQLTLPDRTEWFDAKGTSLKDQPKSSIMKIKTGRINNRRFLLMKKNNAKWSSIMPHFPQYMRTGNLIDGKEWWQHYYEEIYTDKFGETEEMLIYNLVKNKLTNLGIKHTIMSINPRCKLPVDLNLKNGKYPRANGLHPNSIGHIMIAKDIMRLL